MPHSYTKYFKNAEWDHPGKIKSRVDTLIDPFKTTSKRDSLLRNRQYWTVCGSHFNKNGKLEGEYSQLIKSGLITSDQFYGVDKEKSIIDNNKKYYPSVNWLHGDFLEVMESAAINGNFSPSIINFDNIRRKEFGAEELMQIMRFIDHSWHGDLLLSANFVLNSPYKKSFIDSGSEIIDCLLSIYFIPDHWTLYPQYYLYHGSGNRSNTWMGTFTFIKKEHTKIITTEGRRIDQWDK